MTRWRVKQTLLPYSWTQPILCHLVLWSQLEPLGKRARGECVQRASYLGSKTCLYTFTHLFWYDSFKWSFPKCLAVEQAILEKKKNNMSKKLWCKEFQTCCKQLPYILVSLLASFFYIILKFSLGPIWDAMKFRAKTAGVKTLLGIENNNLENFLFFFLQPNHDISRGKCNIVMK